jgi:hypothetical protein
MQAGKDDKFVTESKNESIFYSSILKWGISVNSMDGFMRLLFPGLMLLLMTSPLGAAVNLNGSFSIGWPSSGISDYSYGAIGVGGTGRLGFGTMGNFQVFACCNYLDFGVEYGFIPRDLRNSTVTLDIYTDFYLINAGPEIRFTRKTGNMRPFLGAMGGITYYNALGRVTGRNITPSLVEYSETSGTTWHVAAEAGTQLILWKSRTPGTRGFVESIFLDLAMIYMVGGQIEVLDSREVRYFGGELLTDNLSSAADMIQLTIGFSLKF